MFFTHPTWPSHNPTFLQFAKVFEKPRRRSQMCAYKFPLRFSSTFESLDIILDPSLWSYLLPSPDSSYQKIIIITLPVFIQITDKNAEAYRFKNNVIFSSSNWYKMASLPNWLFFPKSVLASNPKFSKGLAKAEQQTSQCKLHGLTLDVCTQRRSKIQTLLTNQQGAIPPDFTPPDHGLLWLPLLCCLYMRSQPSSQNLKRYYPYNCSQNAFILLENIPVMVNFICQLGWNMVPRYVIKYYSRGFCGVSGFLMTFTFKLVGFK